VTHDSINLIQVNCALCDEMAHRGSAGAESGSSRNTLWRFDIRAAGSYPNLDRY